MARPTGKRNSDYSDRRKDLLEDAIKRLLAECQNRPSLRALADAAGVSLPTIVHYFGSRTQLLESVFILLEEGGRPYLEHVREPSGTFSTSIRELVLFIANRFKDGVLVAIHSLGLMEGIRNDEVGPLYLKHLLEPTIEAIGVRLQKHIERREMRRVDVRYAANALLSPILIAFLHQTELSGKKSYPVEIEAFLRSHSTGFIRGYGKPRSKKTQTVLEISVKEVP
jgi:AcrR family transcriptional regulator